MTSKTKSTLQSLLKTGAWENLHWQLSLKEAYEKLGEPTSSETVASPEFVLNSLIGGVYTTITYDALSITFIDSQLKSYAVGFVDDYYRDNPPTWAGTLYTYLYERNQGNIVSILNETDTHWLKYTLPKSYTNGKFDIWIPQSNVLFLCVGPDYPKLSKIIVTSIPLGKAFPTVRLASP